jgi:tetratricopeptide (TPR) repeat protein
LNLNPKSYEGRFNLGDALYRQDKFDEAAKEFNAAANSEELDDLNRSKAFHNLGNAHFKEQKFKESIEAYKKGLKLDPENNTTRENLAKALSKLKQQEQEQQNSGKNDQKQENKDQQEQDQDKKEGDKQKAEEKDMGENQNKDKQDKDADPGKQVSKADAERILNALKNQERELHKKLQAKPQPKSRTEKDW